MDQDGFEESLSITQTMEVHNGKEGGAGLVGSVVDGKYRIIRRLGGGGMGEVYEAQHLLMKRRVALKLLHKHLLDGQDGEFLRRFEREAQTASQIEHPATVAIYDFGVDSGVSYLAMQFNPGVDLKTLLAREGRLNPHRVMSFIEQIGSALSFAHRQGIVHRDLKPENIMVRDEFEQERVQVLDFGLAKMVQEEEDAVTTMTKTGIIMGTPHYMSPEQIEARALDGRSDLYSLGVITYQLLVNRLPFTADSPMKVILMQLAEPPKPLKEANPDVNLASAVEDVVMKALAKKRDDRQVSVQAFVEELRQAIKGERSLSERHQVPKEFNVARARRSPWQMSVVASFLMVMVFFGAGVASNEVVLKLFPQWVHEQERIAEAEALGVEAEEAMERGDYRKAVLHKLDLAAQLDTQKALWPYRLGLAQTQLLNYADAEVSLQQAIDKDPRFVSAHYELGNVYFRRGQFSQASKEFKTVLRLEPKHGEAKKNLQLLKEFDS